MGVLEGDSAIPLKEQIEKYEEQEPLLIRKAVVSRYFNEPFSEIEDRLTIYEINMLYKVALHLVGTIDMAPFKNTKAAGNGR